MDFGTPENVKDFPGLYGHDMEPDSDSEARGSKQLIGKRKDKKEKDIGYAALGDSSGDDEGDGKSPLKGKMGNPFKFSKKEKRDKEKQKEHKEKAEHKVKEAKEKEGKLKDSKDKHREEKAKEKIKEEKSKEKVKEEKSKDKVKEEKIKEKEKHKEEKHREKEKLKEKARERGKEEKIKEKTKDGKEKSREVKDAKESSKGDIDERKKKKKDQIKGKERKKSDPVLTPEEEPTFGVPLALAVERSKCHDGVQLPAVVRECIDYIEQNGLNCEGIYRLSGVKSKVQQLRRLYNNRDVVCLYDHEPHTVASLLKLFLRELPEPVLTAELLPLFDAAAGQKDTERRVSQLRVLLARLPDPNRLLVQYMFKHMEHIIKREKINKMNVQNVSLVLSPTMQISHRVLNAFFLYGKILFTGVTIKRYVPPMVEGELPDTAEAIREEIEKQESLLTQLHRQLESGSISQRREEQLWEAQRILTQLKRRQRFVRKRSEVEPAGSRSAEGEAVERPAAAHRLERTVQIINEDNVTVIQIGEKAPPVSATSAPSAGRTPPENDATLSTADPALPATDPVLPAADTALPAADPALPAADHALPAADPALPAADPALPAADPALPAADPALPAADPALPAADPSPPADTAPAEPEPQPEQKQEPVGGSGAEPVGGSGAEPTLPLGENQTSFSDLHRRLNPVPDAVQDPLPAPVQDPEPAPICVVPSEPLAALSETAALLQEAILLKLEEEELQSTAGELRSRLAAERGEIGRLRDTIQEMETLYKYRTYSVDSSDDSSGEDSDDSDTEEDLMKQLLEIARHNQQLQAKNAQTVQSIHETRRCCQRRRAQIRYLELQQAGRP